MTTGLRSIWRLLRKSPATSAFAVVVLTLGIGLTTSMFSILYGVLLSPVPFADPERVMSLAGYDLDDGPLDDPDAQNTPHDFADWRDQQKSFVQLAAYDMNSVRLNDEAGYPERFNAARTTWNTFDLLGIQPVLGRAFMPEDDLPGAEPVVLIGHDLWTHYLAGDPNVVGRRIRIDDEPTTIVGVMPEGVEFPIFAAVWQPLRLDLSTIERGSGGSLWVVGRLRDGVTRRMAQAEMTAIAARQGEDWPETSGGRGVQVKDYRQSLNSPADVAIVGAMFGAVVLVLLIACANVACLLLAKATERSRELAIRTALGAKRGRIIGLVLLESLLLSALGALGGLALADFLTRALTRAFSWKTLPYWITFELRPSAVLFVVAAALGVGLIAGLLPALRASGTISFDLLKDEARGTSSLRIGRLTRALVMVELSLAFALLVVTGLMVRSVLNFHHIDPGFATESIFTARLHLPKSTFPEDADVNAFYARLTDDLAAQSEVASAAVMSKPPGTYMGSSYYALEDKSYARQSDYPNAPRGVVSPTFFMTFGISPVAGRLFDRQDDADHPPVVIVNQSFAAETWPGESAIGKRLRLGRGEADEPWRTVVGVVPDAGVSLLLPRLAGSTGAGFYVPHAQLVFRSMSVAVATRGDASAFASRLRERLTVLAPGLPLEEERTMERVVWEETFAIKLVSFCFTLFGGTALLLAAAGIFGVTLFSVAQRVREFGIRLALGALPRDVVGLVVKQGLGRLLLGLGIGLGLALGLGSVLRVALYGVTPSDPTTILTAATVLVLATLIACFLPAWRASRVDPLEALRHD